jgi:ribonuclease G
MAETLSILVKAKGEQRHIAVLSEGKLAEYYEETETEGTLVNAVVLGRVENVVPGMKTAFISIGQPQNGFLPIVEMESYRQNADEKPLVSGAEVIVQVKKDPKEQKGAYLTRDIALPGETLIFMPLNRYVGVSQRVTDEQARETLAALGRELGAGECGLILRYAALAARREAVADELAELKARWSAIRAKAEHLKAPATLYQEPSALTALARDYAPRYQVSVTCNDAVNRMPSPPAGLMWEQIGDSDMDAAWKAASVDAQVAQALCRRVELKNGGTLIIDEREALSTVDVNSGKFIGEKEGALAFKQNLASCAEVARQIRLRNLSGIVLVDFIDMDTDDERAQVIERLKAELSRERGKTVIHGFTSLGLLEMTRKRTGASLREALLVPCDACCGTGYRPANGKGAKRGEKTPERKGERA